MNRERERERETIRVGVIGLGRQSLNDHIPAVLRQNNLQIVGAVDTDEAAHRNFQNSFPDLKDIAKLFTKIGDLIDMGIDIAIVALPHNQYLETCGFLAKNKIPFMKEKPFARSLDEAVAIARIPDIEKYCFTCTQRRFNPLYQKAHVRLKSFGRLASPARALRQKAKPNIFTILFQRLRRRLPRVF